MLLPTANGIRANPRSRRLDARVQIWPTVIIFLPPNPNGFIEVTFGVEAVILKEKIVVVFVLYMYVM